MTLVHCSGDEARGARDGMDGGERQLRTAAGWVDVPSWREAAADDPGVGRDAKHGSTSGVRQDFEYVDEDGRERVHGWELTHAAARQWADRNATYQNAGGDA